GRNQLLSIEEPLAFGASIEAYSAKDPLAEDSIVHHWMAHPGGSPLWEMLHPSADLVRVWIGPEGGFSDAEISTGISAGLTTIDLGKRIYRIETAACAIASLLGD
ncbi:MAG: RsmE family RNA methyltransferase, partial [Planctomycetota bacterium]